MVLISLEDALDLFELLKMSVPEYESYSYKTAFEDGLKTYRNALTRLERKEDEQRK